MRDLETEMAKALEGQFFWEHTATPEMCLPTEVRQIVVAQRKYYVPKKKTEEERRAEKARKLEEIIAREQQKEAEFCRVNHPLKGDIDGFINRLVEVVASVHEVSPDDIRSKARGLGSSPVKHHFVWSFRRYFPGMTMSDAARFIGKDRSTLVNSVERFEEMIEDNKDKIAAVDLLMGYAGVAQLVEQPH